MLQHIKIEKFWEKYTIDWKPNSDVNILVGINGSGKSTLLRMLDVALSNSSDVKSSLDKLMPMWNKILLKGNKILVDLNGFGGNDINNNECLYNFINTFDEIIYEKKALNQELTPLTAQLDAVIFNTKANSLNSYRLKATENPTAGIRVSEQLQQWIEVVNSFFATTNKTFEIQGSDVFFKQENGKKLTLDKLSSGEKQMLVILTNALVQDKEPFILLMDEPEISLDIDWQYKLISTIRTLNPNCQLFIATHSPGIFGDGWSNKIVFMEDLLKKN